MTPADLTHLDIITVAALWTAAALRVPIALRQPRSLAWLLAIIIEALSMTVNEPRIGASLNRFSHIPFLETLAKHVLFLSFEALIFLVTNVVVDYRARRNQRAIVIYTVATAVAMTLLFIFANHGAGPHFLPRHPTWSPLVFYWLTYLSYVIVDSTIAFLVFWGVSRRARPAVLRVSFRFLAVGFAAGIGYAVLYLPLIFKPVASLFIAMQLVMYAGLLTFVIGSSLAAVPDYVAMTWSYRSRLKLYPLWRSLLSATPGIALSKPRGLLYELSVVNLDHKLYRRIIEIRDGLIALRAYIPDRLPDQAHQFVLQHHDRVTDPEMTATACILEAARQAKQRGETRPNPIAAHPYLQLDISDSSLADEVARLVQLADAQRSQVVREFANTAGVPTVH